MRHRTNLTLAVMTPRFHKLNEKGLEVDISVEEPGAFTMPWSAIQRYRRFG